MLLAGIIFVSAKININSNSQLEGFIIDLQQPTPIEEIIEQQKQQELNKADYDNVKNAVSNENAKEMTARERQQAIQADKLLSEAEKVLKGTSSNRDRYEQGLKEEQEILNSKNSKDKGESKAQDSKVQGNVTVSFSFVNPVRNSYKLVIPAYMCEGGGEVVVNAMLNRNGSVISASVDKSRSTTDECMVTTALRAARESRFNVDSSAPDRHQGTISYIFIPQ